MAAIEKQLLSKGNETRKKLVRNARTRPYNTLSPAAGETLDLVPEDTAVESIPPSSSTSKLPDTIMDCATVDTTINCIDTAASTIRLTADLQEDITSLDASVSETNTRVYEPELMEIEVETSSPVDTDEITLDPIPKRWIIVEELWLGLYNTNEELASTYAESFIDQLKRA